MPSMRIDTTNVRAVAVGTWPGGHGELSGTPAIIILAPPQPGALMTPEGALTLAAWLVALADGPVLDDAGVALEGSVRTRFDQILEAVHST